MDGKKLLTDFKKSMSAMMSFGQNSVIGLDIGQHSLKAAEVSLSRQGQIRLHQFAYLPLPEGTILEREIHNQESLEYSLNKLLGQFKSKNLQICLGFSGPGSICRRLQLAGGSDEDIEDQVTWESEQYIPFSIDDAFLSYDVIGTNEGGGIDVLVACARKSHLQRYIDILNQLNYQVSSATLDLIAIGNIFELSLKTQLLNAPGTWLFLNIGAQFTQFIIYRKGAIYFSKDIFTGGLTITEEIQRQMGVSYLEAEDLKMSKDGKGHLPEEIVDIIYSSQDAILREISSSIEFYIQTTNDESLEDVVVSGGGCLTTGLLEALQNHLKLKVHILPIDKVLQATHTINISPLILPTVLGLGLNGIKGKK